MSQGTSFGPSLSIARNSMRTASSMRQPGRFKRFRQSLKREWDEADQRLFDSRLYRDMWSLQKKLDPDKKCHPVEMLVLAIVLIVIGILLVWFLTNTDETMGLTNEYKLDENGKEDVGGELEQPETIDERQKKRGQYISILMSIFFGGFNTIMDGFGQVNSATSTALFGLLLGGTVGFMCDIGYASDTGKRTIDNDGFSEMMDYVFATLASGKYTRFLVVTLIDTFISLMLFSVAYPILLKLPVFRCFPSVTNGFISALIAVITFQAYANQTRFEYAYPDPKATPSQVTPTVIILLVTAVTATTFLKVNTMTAVDEGYGIDVQGINHPTIKLILVMLVFTLLTGLVYAGRSDPELQFTYTSRSIYKNPEDVQTTIEEGIDGAPSTEKELECFPTEDRECIIEYIKKYNDNFKQFGKDEMVSSSWPIYGRIIFSVILSIGIFGTMFTAQAPLARKISAWIFWFFLFYIPVMYYVWVGSKTMMFGTGDSGTDSS